MEQPSRTHSFSCETTVVCTGNCAYVVIGRQHCLRNVAQAWRDLNPYSPAEEARRFFADNPLSLRVAILLFGSSVPASKLAGLVWYSHRSRWRACFLEPADPDRFTRTRGFLPGHLGVPEDVAEAVLFRVSERAKYIYGDTIGRWRAQPGFRGVTHQILTTRSRAKHGQAWVTAAEFS